VFAYDGDNLVEETNSSGVAVARYEQTQNIYEPLAMLRSASTSYYHAGGLGTITSLSNMPGFCSSVSSAQDGCHDPRIAATVEYSQDNEGFFIWCVRDQKIPYRMKPQWPRSKVGTTVTLLRKGDEGTNRLMDFLKNTVSSAQIVRCDEFPDFVEVCESVWVEDKPAHEWRR